MDIGLSAKPSVFLVSGASRGLGRAIVEAALGAGHHVVAGVRSTTALSDLAAKEPDHLAGTPRTARAST